MLNTCTAAHNVTNRFDETTETAHKKKGELLKVAHVTGNQTSITQSRDA